MASPSDDLLSELSRRIASLEQIILKLPQAKMTAQIEKFDALLTQLNHHVNPTREEVALLKRTNRELAREMQKLSLELGRKLL